MRISCGIAGMPVVDTTGVPHFTAFGRDAWSEAGDSNRLRPASNAGLTRPGTGWSLGGRSWVVSEDCNRGQL
jgi:hypothetical protein